LQYILSLSFFTNKQQLTLILFTQFLRGWSTCTLSTTRYMYNIDNGRCWVYGVSVLTILQSSLVMRGGNHVQCKCGTPRSDYLP